MYATILRGTGSYPDGFLPRGKHHQTPLWSVKIVSHSLVIKINHPICVSRAQHSLFDIQTTPDINLNAALWSEKVFVYMVRFSLMGIFFHSSEIIHQNTQTHSSIKYIYMLSFGVPSSIHD